MVQILTSVSLPILSLIILLLGNTFLTTLLTIRLESLGGNDWQISSLSSAYYLGFVIGAYYIERFIRRVGHIRAYATFASFIAIISLLHGLFLTPTAWIILRFFCGIAISGVFIIIESWLLSKSSSLNRGSILSIYMISVYASQSLGQFFLKVVNYESLIAFCLITILSSLSVIPISITYTPSPTLEEHSVLSFKKLYQISPTGILGCLFAGMILSGIYGLLPMFLYQIGTLPTDIGLIMFVTIFGGMMLQYPIGRLSDKIERRRMILLVGFLTLLACWSMLISAYYSPIFFKVSAFIFGGFAFTLYPLCISHACDHIDPKDIIAATGGLLLAYSVGSTIGPLFVPLLTALFGPPGLFVYFSISAALIVVFVFWRSTQEPPIAANEQQHDFIAVPPTTVVTELDPRVEPEEGKE